MSESVGRSVRCPACSYDLRGACERIVTCPECGLVTDRKRLGRRWSRRWTKLPLYRLLLMPVHVVALALPPLLFAGVCAFVITTREAMLIAAGCLAGALIVWGVMLRYVTRRFGSVRGLWLSLISHAVMIAYIVGALGGVFAATAVLLSIMNVTWSSLLPSLLGLGSCVTLLWFAYQADQYVGRSCLEEHQRHRTRRGRVTRPPLR